MPRSTSSTKGKKSSATYQEIGQLFQYNPLPMWAYDLETLAFLSVNNAAIKNYGFSEEEFLTMTIKDIRPKDEVPALMAEMKIKKAKPTFEHSGTWLHRTKDGRLLTVAITTQSIEYKKRKAVLVVAQDISQQKIAEQAWRESEDRLRRQAELVENVTDAIISCDLDFHIITWNKAAETIYGWKAEEVIGQDWDRLCQTKYADTTREKRIDKLYTTGKWSGGFEQRRKDGRSIYVQSHMSIVQNANGTPVRIVTVNRDISQRRTTEVALRESQRQLSTLMSNLPGMAYRGKNDAEWTMEFVSDGCETLTGYNPADLIDNKKISYEQVTHPDDRQRVREIIESSIKKHEPFKMTYRIVTAGGEEKWVWEQGTAIYDDFGNVIALEGFIADTTERISAENALRESEERFRAAFEQAAVGVTQVTLKGEFENVNQKFCEIVGYSKKELIGRNAQEFIYSEDIKINAEKVEQLLKGEITTFSIESRFTRKDGFVVWVNLSVGPVRDEDGRPKYLIGVSEDITERKTRERELDALYQSGASLEQISDRKAVALKVIELLERLMEWHHAAIWIRQGQSENIEQLAYSHSHPDLETLVQERTRSQAIMRTLHDGFAGWVILHGTTVRSGDVVNDPRYAKVNDSIRSGLYVPLKVGKETIGCITAESMHPNAFSAYDERLLTTVAAQAAVALDNARLYEQTHKNAEQLSKLNALSRELATTLSLPSIYHTAHSYVRQFLDCSNFGISLFDSIHQLINPVFLIMNGQEIDLASRSPVYYDHTQAGSGHAKAITTASPVILNDVVQEAGISESVSINASHDREPKSAIYTPMVVDGLVVGILEIQSYQKDAYSAADAELLNSIANQIGLSIQNARLFSQIDHQLQQLSALRSIDNAISSNTDLSTTLSIILDHVKSELGVDAADILLFKPETMTLEYAADRGFHSDAIQRISLRLGEGIAGKTAVERKPALIENLDDGEFHYVGVLSDEKFVTYSNTPLVSKGQIKGVLEVFHRSVLKTDREWLTFLEMMGNEAAIAIDNADLFNELQRSNLDLTIAYDATIEGWAQALELRDSETEGHSRRVTEMTLRLARQMNIQGPELVHIRRGSLLHDIGKMGVPDYILRKPGPLTDGEWSIMRQHPTLAHNLLSRIPYLRPALDIPYCHHEHWDGSGYPRKLRGEQIPLSARLFAVVDVYDALTSDRPYRKALGEKDAFDYIGREIGKHFDPRAVEMFLKMMNVDESISMLSLRSSLPKR